ncbi:MAG: NAD(P)H-dependent oxidoreductase subunit E [Firmicutes bacterium]|nr:NAD(P)H-dependent oxidoreductase subunit E [Bacillota bacterium]
MCNCKEMEKKFEQLDQIIDKHKAERGALIPVLHEAQEVFGYLPYEVQERIADGLGLSMAKVYGVVTFYSQFSLKQKGKYKINVCMGTACYVKGANDILGKFLGRLKIPVGECTADGKFSLESCRCIGACGLAPVVTINDEVYGRLTPEMVDQIMDEYEGKE